MNFRDVDFLLMQLYKIYDHFVYLKCALPRAEGGNIGLGSDDDTGDHFVKNAFFKGQAGGMEGAGPKASGGVHIGDGKGLTLKAPQAIVELSTIRSGHLPPGLFRDLEQPESDDDESSLVSLLDEPERLLGGGGEGDDLSDTEFVEEDEHMGEEDESEEEYEEEEEEVPRQLEGGKGGEIAPGRREEGKEEDHHGDEPLEESDAELLLHSVSRWKVKADDAKLLDENTSRWKRTSQTLEAFKVDGDATANKQNELSYHNNDDGDSLLEESEGEDDSLPASVLSNEEKFARL